MGTTNIAHPCSSVGIAVSDGGQRNSITNTLEVIITDFYHELDRWKGRGGEGLGSRFFYPVKTPVLLCINAKNKTPVFVRINSSSLNFIAQVFNPRFLPGSDPGSQPLFDRPHVTFPPRSSSLHRQKQDELNTFLQGSETGYEISCARQRGLFC